MYYKHELDKCNDPQYVARKLLELRQQFRDERVPKRTTENLMMATWNIREFDSPAYGERLAESFLYIAQIIEHFDIVAVQEVRKDLRALDRLVQILGSNWSYVVSDVTEGTRGNKERLAFLFDTRKVHFGGVAGEVVVPPVKAEENKVYHPARQLYRTPYLVGFRSGWRRFMLCTVHVLFGEGVADNKDRAREVELVAEFLQKRARSGSAYSDALILLGDFNIFTNSDITMKALTNASFIVPPELQDVPATNLGKKKRRYDQIAFLPAERSLGSTGNAGVFDFYKTVFKTGDHPHYGPDIGEKYDQTVDGNPRDEASKERYFKTYWRTYQMSDHLLMWIELKVDFADEYLEYRS